MKFFTDIDELLSDNVSLSLNIQRSGEGLVVTVLPKVSSSDEAIKKIPPMVLRGTMQEIDDNFFDAISKPIQSTTDFFDNIVDYEKGLEKATAESKIAEAKKKEKKEKEEKDKKEAEKCIENLDKLMENKNYATVELDAKRYAEKYPKSATKFKAYATDARTKRADQGQVDIFAVPGVEEEDESGAFEVAAAEEESNNENELF